MSADSPPDVWGLLEACLTVIEEERASPSVCRNINAALAQRDRWQLVPKERVGRVCHEPHELRGIVWSMDWRDLPPDTELFAAAPKPEGKP
jgi:hypothetical protein